MFLAPIDYVERDSGALAREKVYGEALLALLYGDSWLSRRVGPIVGTLLRRVSLASRFYGWLQRRPRSRKKIRPFVEAFGLDASTFEKNLDEFVSFDDFFVRKLRAESRPIAEGSEVLVAPADGRYWVCPDISRCEGFLVKGKKFSLPELLGSEKLAKHYERGAMVMIRLCPSDYHRFHFPCTGIPTEAQEIPGWLGSVNPAATKKRISIFSENKRAVTSIATERFGSMLYIEVGATCVGTIHETFTPGKRTYKGEEKGFFSFGGSSIILLFERNRVLFSQDLLHHSQDYLETLCLMGQAIGSAIHPEVLS